MGHNDRTDIQVAEMRSKTPVVSVILPTHNRAGFLAASINSVLKQSFGDFELIVIDDGSTDSTEEVVSTFKDNRIRYIGYEPNHGGAHARNVGLEAARSDLVAFQDSDDEWLPGKLSKQVEAIMSASSETGVVYTDMLRLGKDGREHVWRSPDIVRGRLASSSSSGSLDYQVICIGIGSALFKKKYIVEVGGFDEDLKRLIDLDLFVRLSFVCDFIHLKEPLIKYYDTDGITSSPYNLFLAREVLLDKYGSRFPLESFFIASQYNLMGQHLLECGKIDEARACFWKAVRINPRNALFIGHAAASLLGLRFCKLARHTLRRYGRMSDETLEGRA
jgi:glycosyltransferase involved in cell wall biosynthesis